MVGILANLCVDITHKEAEKLEIENMFSKFLCLFDRLTYTTSTIPVMISNILLTAASLAVGGPDNHHLDLILVHAVTIIDNCIGSVENVEELFNKDCFLPLLKSIEILIMAKGEGKNKFDNILTDMLYGFFLCFIWS